MLPAQAMEFDAVHSLYASFGDDRLSLVYSGAFPDDHTARLISLAEQAVDNDEGRRTEQARLAFIMVEAYQNIIRHRASVPEHLARDEGRSLFMLRSGPSAHSVTSIDPGRSSDAGKLRELLAHVEGKDRAQLKEMFMRALKHGRISERGGAGLGIIEMARRSGNTLLHDISPIDADHVRFILRMTLGDAHQAPGGKDLEDIATLHAEIARHDVLLLFRGRPLSGMLELLLRMMQRDLRSVPERAKSCSRALLAATDVLQSFDPDREHDCILVLHGNGPGHGVHFGTWLDTGRASALEVEVEAMRAMGRSGIQQRYRNLLMAGPDRTERATMGLLELARHPGAALAMHRRREGTKEFILFKASL